MADPGDDARLLRHYRDLATETPPAALDDAILASARRAVGSAPRRRTSRWAMPVSIAAILFLALGVTLRLQVEAPQVASPSLQESPREAVEAPPQPTPQAQAVPPAQPAAEAARDSRPAATSEPPARPKATANRTAAPVRRESAEAFVAPPPAASVAPLPAPVTASPPAAPAPLLAAPVPGLAADSAAAEPALQSSPQPKDAENRSRAPAAPAQPALAKRAKEERVEPLAAPATAGALMERKATSPERRLEEIASMRREGRHREADEALLAFQREHPGFRIPPETWERVRPTVR